MIPYVQRSYKVVGASIFGFASFILLTRFVKFIFCTNCIIRAICAISQFLHLLQILRIGQHRFYILYLDRFFCNPTVTIIIESYWYYTNYQ
jgi:hypothetical protein